MYTLHVINLFVNVTDEGVTHGQGETTEVCDAAECKRVEGKLGLFNDSESICLVWR
jgi:hypothetical protein